MFGHSGSWSHSCWVWTLLAMTIVCFSNHLRPSQYKIPVDKYIIISVRLFFHFTFSVAAICDERVHIFYQVICSSEKQCVASVCKRIMRHLLALRRNRWKPMPYLFVNLMELTIQTSLKLPWNLRQILPLGKKKQTQPVFLSGVCCVAGSVLKPCKPAFSHLVLQTTS